MDFKQYFSPYTDKINIFLEEFLQEKIKESKNINSSLPLLWKNMKDIIIRGKRIRGNLIRLGYNCFKKNDGKNLLPVSVALELTQSAILIHDDVIDQSKLRRNQLTVHERYKNYHLKKYKKGDSSHYGESMAIVLGIIGYYESIKLLTQIPFKDELKTKVIHEFSSFMINTGYGEGLDVDLSYRKTIKQKDIFDIYIYKTAYYTIIGPLKIGAILAGAKQKDLKIFEDYGTSLGIAFQIQDDILGVFGNEKSTGKKTGDDIKEGKNTILFTQALKRADSKQKQILKKFWGKRDINIKEINQIREIIIQTGSLRYCQKLAIDLIKEAKNKISKITKEKNLQEIFSSLADFIIKREK